MGNKFKHRILGALLECYIEFPLFRDDYRCLEANGFVRQVSPERCEWLKSKTSLAEYFKWVGRETGRITGGFWCPVSRAFGMNKGQLQKLAGRNGNWCKPEESRDFAVLKALVLPRRRKAARIRREAAAFNSIAKLVNETKCGKPETIHDVLQEIEKILAKNVEKNSDK
jgi:FAD/FMN-containing dehydrogenase